MPIRVRSRFSKEFDSIMVANADTVLQAVAANPGTSAGLSLAEIRSIFAGLCSHLEAMLERRRSIVVPVSATSLYKSTLATAARGERELRGFRS
jgi:hypothetical protein